MRGKWGQLLLYNNKEKKNKQEEKDLFYKNINIYHAIFSYKAVTHVVS